MLLETASNIYVLSPPVETQVQTAYCCTCSAATISVNSSFCSCATLRCSSSWSARHLSSSTARSRSSSSCSVVFCVWGDRCARFRSKKFMKTWALFGRRLVWKHSSPCQERRAHRPFRLKHISHFEVRGLTLIAAFTTDNCRRSIVRIWAFSAVTSPFILALPAPCKRMAKEKRIQAVLQAQNKMVTQGPRTDEVARCGGPPTAYVQYRSRSRK